MAGRLPKVGIDFSRWETDMFDDDKYFLLLQAQGWRGFGIFFYVCQLIYKTNGYYMEWHESSSAMIAQRAGGGLRAATVEATIQACLRSGLFDKRLYDRSAVLTSRAIQKRYASAIVERVDKSVIAEYWLLSASENEKICRGLVFCAVSEHLSSEKLNFSPEKLNFSPCRVEESREEESRADTHTLSPVRTYEAPSAREVREYFKCYGLIKTEADAFIRYNEKRGWDCLPDWVVKADLWISRVKKKEDTE
jgi:hypothetical protein